jgi:hypothetical protein
MSVGPVFEVAAHVVLFRQAWVLRRPSEVKISLELFGAFSGGASAREPNHFRASRGQNKL